MLARGGATWCKATPSPASAEAPTTYPYGECSVFLSRRSQKTPVGVLSRAGYGAARRSYRRVGQRLVIAAGIVLTGIFFWRPWVGTKSQVPAGQSADPVAEALTAFSREARLYSIQPQARRRQPHPALRYGRVLIQLANVHGASNPHSYWALLQVLTGPGFALGDRMTAAELLASHYDGYEHLGHVVLAMPYQRQYQAEPLLRVFASSEVRNNKLRGLAALSLASWLLQHRFRDPESLAEAQQLLELARREAGSERDPTDPSVSIADRAEALLRSSVSELAAPSVQSLPRTRPTASSNADSSRSSASAGSSL
jgi:hypothetical protein